jgi:hypothetical protein
MLRPVASKPASGRKRLTLDFFRVAFRIFVLDIDFFSPGWLSRDLRMPAGNTEL